MCRKCNQAIKDSGSNPDTSTINMFMDFKQFCEEYGEAMQLLEDVNVSDELRYHLDNKFALYENVKWVALTALITGVIGKFLTNFFTEEEVQVNRRGRKPKNP